MTPEDEVRAAILSFYAALEELFTTGNTESMKNAWLHSPRVSSSHPFGPWLYGWEDIWTTWLEFSHLAKKENNGTSIQKLKIEVYGDIAYVTGVFTSSPAFGSPVMNVTNILNRHEGAWKIIHHHADKTPIIETKFNELAEEG